MAPKISVAMAVYNGEKYLKPAVESVLLQTFTDFELLVVDDGSKDSSGAILDEYAAKDPRVQVFHIENRGLIGALNFAIREAKGEYLARMDADDVCRPERFLAQVSHLDSHPATVAVGTKVQLIDPEGMPIKKFASKLTHEEIDTEHLAGRGGAICHPAVMIRTQTLKEVGGYREEALHAEDLDLFLRLAEVGKLHNLEDIGLDYRMHPLSVGHTKRELQWKSADWAVSEARKRRGLPHGRIEALPKDHGPSALHRKWAWWALSDEQLATARKHAARAVRLDPRSAENWRVLAVAVRDTLFRKSS